MRRPRPRRPRHDDHRRSVAADHVLLREYRRRGLEDDRCGRELDQHQRRTDSPGLDGRHRRLPLESERDLRGYRQLQDPQQRLDRARDVQEHGRRRDLLRPWLGVYSEEVRGHVLVTQVLRGAPADLGGLKRGDVILAIDGKAIGSQSEFYEILWGGFSAGDEITLQIWRNKLVRELKLRSIDRLDYLRPWSLSTH